jgi:hypothetical protein
MAHFAQIDENGIVLQVIVIDNSNCPGPVPVHSEPAGQAYIASIGLEGHWIQTSYNGTFRGVYAGIGYLWDPDTEMFTAPALPEQEETDE